MAKLKAHLTMKGAKIMDFLKRFKNGMNSFGYKAAIALQEDHDKLAPAANVGIAIGVAMHMAAITFADDDIAGLGTSVAAVIANIYSSLIVVVTGFAAVLLVIAFLTRMSGNPQQSAMATQWIKRIILAYACINCIGTLFSVIDNTTAGRGWKA